MFLKCNGVVPIPTFYSKMLPDPVGSPTLRRRRYKCASILDVLTYKSHDLEQGKVL